MRHLCHQGKYLQSNIHSQLLGNTAVTQIKSWAKFSYSITRLIYTITHNNNNSSSSDFLKMGFLLLKAEWDQCFNFCSELHGAGGWMWLSTTQINISLMLSCPFPFINLFFLSPPKNDSHLSWQGIHRVSQTPWVKTSVVWSVFFPWWRGLIQRTFHHQVSQQPLPVLVGAFWPSCFTHSDICTLHLSMFPAF